MQQTPLDFKKMKWYEKLYWRIKLFMMDHPCPLFFHNQRGDILEPSYEYTHTPEEVEEELKRRKDELLTMIESADAK